MKLPFETHQKHGEGLKSAGKNLIYIILVCLICGTIAFGFCVLQAYYIDGCSDSKNSTIQERNRVKLEYKWPENVEKVINDVIDNNDRMTMNDDRGVLIKAELMKFDTSDVFYIIVYDGVDGPLNHALYGDKNEYIHVAKPGKMNVVVFRSHFWRSSPQSAYEKMKQSVEESCKKGLKLKSNYSDVPKELMANFKDTNFIGLIGKEFEVSVRSANSFGRVWGPGYWDTVAVLDSQGNKTGKEFILVAGYI
ncbi:unnamed protein product [Caenorhabditis nigoni]